MKRYHIIFLKLEALQEGVMNMTLNTVSVHENFEQAKQRQKELGTDYIIYDTQGMIFIT